jgi:DNA polymerase-3 subunit alpha
MAAKVKTKLITLLDKFAVYQEKFFVKIKDEGFEKDVAQYWWDTISSQAEYSFALAHASSYSKLTYLTMYLKSKYPKQFFISLFNNTKRAKEDKEGINEISKIASTARKDFRLTLYPPDINKSFPDFVSEGEGIRFGLDAIKDVGKSSEKVVEFKPYKSFKDFLEKQRSNEIVNRRVILALIYSGCFDSIDPDRNFLVNYYNSLKSKIEVSQASFIDMSEVIGQSATGSNENRLALLKKEIEYLNMTFKEIGDSKEFPTLSRADFKGEEIKCTAFIESIKERVSKKGKSYLYMKVTDFSASITVMAFNDTKEYLSAMEPEKGNIIKLLAAKASGSSDLYFAEKVTIQKNDVT